MAGAPIAGAAGTRIDAAAMAAAASTFIATSGSSRGIAPTVRVPRPPSQIGRRVASHLDGAVFGSAIEVESLDRDARRRRADLGELELRRRPPRWEQPQPSAEDDRENDQPDGVDQPGAFGQEPAKISYVRRPSTNASTSSKIPLMYSPSCSSKYGTSQPPCWNPSRGSSAGPPGPW